MKTTIVPISLVFLLGMFCYAAYMYSQREVRGSSGQTTPSAAIAKGFPTKGNCSQSCPDISSADPLLRYDIDPVTGCRRLYCLGKAMRGWDLRNSSTGLFTCQRDRKWHSRGVALPKNATAICSDPISAQNQAYKIYKKCEVPKTAECPSNRICNASALITHEDVFLRRSHLVCRNKQLLIKEGDSWKTDITAKCVDVETSTWRTDLEPTGLLSSAAAFTCADYVSENHCNKCAWVDTGSVKTVFESCEADTKFIRLRCPSNKTISTFHYTSRIRYRAEEYIYCNEEGRWTTPSGVSAKSPRGWFVAMVKCE